MIVALTYGGLSFLVMAFVCAWSFRAVKDTVPGWRRHGTPERPRALVRGVIRQSDSVVQLAPLSGQPCVAWRVRLRARRGAIVIKRRRDVLSDSRFMLDTQSEPVAVELPGYDTHREESDRFLMMNPWVVCVDKLSILPSVVLRHGVLISPLRQALDSRTFEQLQRAALALAERYEMTDPDLADTDIHIDEVRFSVGDRCICEGPNARDGGTLRLFVPGNLSTGEGTTYPAKLAFQDRFAAAQRHAILREFTFAIVIGSIFLLPVLLALPGLLWP